MKMEKFLPIGTVVILKEGKKRVMILGFCVKEEGNEKIYDYSGCIYTEGLVKQGEVLLFDHEQIEKIYHLGLIDEEEIAFKNKINELIKQNNLNESV